MGRRNLPSHSAVAALPALLSLPFQSPKAYCSRLTIKKLILAIFVAALPFAAVAADKELVGTYKLISSTRTILDTGQVEAYANEQ